MPGRGRRKYDRDRGAGACQAELSALTSPPLTSPIHLLSREGSMSDTTTTPRTKVIAKTERPRLHKVILLNDDYTPREFVVTVLKAVFRMSEDTAYKVMMTAHRRGACVVSVYPRDVAETKATQGTEAGRAKGYPLMFTTEPEE